MTLQIDMLVVADPPSAWAEAGFTVDGDAMCRIGGVGVELAGRERGFGIVGWSLEGLTPGVGDVDGIPTARSVAKHSDSVDHPNGVTAVDHIVLASPDLDRTVGALRHLGAQPRRERDATIGDRQIRQVFYRFGETIVEVVGSPAVTDPGPSTLWGITFVVDDIDEAASYFGDRTSAVKDAVQPGRRITTLRHHDLGMSVRTALISARPARR
ncbi:VOC family protein [Mycolicibacterium sp. 018/SC-01/001]|uniref:VOC family protein n=1 Tax=Mycolicibacterium sp. 018/SC-01/001 TaxID=2592069 RepID=UPI00117F5A77|nr:VOC family protein [Mycolicibacterium sp. 018/SC-01/001]TRW82051.1 VOC family protein [Mycolicibacterium sp. 018/SC-01/001]